MDEITLYEKILSLSKPWSVDSIELNEADNSVHVNVTYDGNSGSCPVCKKPCTRYDTRSRTWRHLDTCQYKTFVHCNVPRANCVEHGVLQIDIPWAEKGSGFTLLFEAFIIDWLNEASINAVSRQTNLSWNAIDGIMKRAVRRGLDRRTELDIKHLCVDEVSQRKGRKYLTIISNHQGHVLDIQDDRSKESLKAFYNKFNEQQLVKVESISMDMCQAYISTTLETIPDAQSKICFDKFHVAKDLNEAVDATRKSEMKSIEPSWRKPLHASRYTWLRDQKNLEKNHKKTIAELTRIANKTARAWTIRQYAMTLWEYKCKTWAKKAWMRWYNWAIRSQLNAIKSSARSIKKNLWGILNAVVLKKTNASAESINSKIKSIKVRAKGFRNKERLKIAILFHCGGLEMKP